MAGFWRTVGVIIGANSADAYWNGSEWAETLYDVDADVSPMQAEQMAEDLSDNPRAFYDGFRDTWNSAPDVEKELSLWDKLCGRG
jgi:hypothetical protein